MRRFPHARPATVNRSVTRMLHLLLLLSMVVGPLALAAPAQAAAPQSAPRAQAACATQHTLMLPLVVGTKATPTTAAAYQSAPGQFVAVQTTARTLDYALETTYTYAYQVVVRNSNFVRDREGARQTDSAVFVVRATAEMTILGRDASNDFTGQLRLLNPFLCSSDGAQDEIFDDAAFNAALATPLAFVQAPNGVVRSVSAPAGANPEAVNLQKGALNLLHMNLHPAQNSYAVAEIGGQGSYTATYQLEEKVDGLHIRKQYDQDDFSSLIAVGDTEAFLTIHEETGLILDGAQRVVRQANLTERIANGDDQLMDDGTGAGYEGISTYAEVNASGSLVLQGSAPANPAQRMRPTGALVEGGLGAALVEHTSTSYGAELDGVDLDNAFDLFEAEVAARVAGESTSLTQLFSILDLILADQGNVVLDKLAVRLNAAAANSELALVYVDLAGMAGSPRAQEILAGVLGNDTAARSLGLSANFDQPTVEQALINVVSLSAPSAALRETVAALSKNQRTPVRRMALAAHGALLHHLLQDDPNTAQRLAGELTTALAQATDPDEIEALLDALGNAGVPASLDVIAGFKDGAVPDPAGGGILLPAVQFAALSAVRKIPGAGAENLLVAALEDPTVPGPTKVEVFKILKKRPDLSPNGKLAIENNNPLPPPVAGNFNQTWERWAGGENFGIHFPGGIKMEASSQAGVSLHGFQEIDGYVIKKKINIADASIVITPTPGNTFLVGAYMKLGNGNLIKKTYEQNVPCVYTQSGNLSQQNTTFYEGSTTVPVAGLLLVTFSFRTGGVFSVNYEYALSACNPLNMTAMARLIPAGNVYAAGEASVSFAVVRGGAGVSATVLNTTIPIEANLSYTGNAYQFCTVVTANSNALTLRVYGFADRIKLLGGWKRVFEGTIYQTTLGQFNWNLLNKCHSS